MQRAIRNRSRADADRVFDAVVDCEFGEPFVWVTVASLTPAVGKVTMRAMDASSSHM
jgi:hypothetical protein